MYKVLCSSGIFVAIGIICLTSCFLEIYSQLLINVQNQGGEVVQETITSNLDDDLITLEFQRTDGTLITQLIDFRNEVQVLKALVLGEEERGQSLYQVMCFITKFLKTDFISCDAMAKLRQKNPSTIRQPEEDRGRENYTMTAWVILNKSLPISRHVAALCMEAKDSTYVRASDLRAWSEIPGSSITNLELATLSFPPTSPSRCNEVSGLWAPCTCSLEMCIGWYPCGLKYCKGKPDIIGNGLIAGGGGNNNASFRCGIKTCRKCNHYSYYVSEKQHCLWDD